MKTSTKIIITTLALVAFGEVLAMATGIQSLRLPVQDALLIAFVAVWAVTTDESKVSK